MTIFSRFGVMVPLGVFAALMLIVPLMSTHNPISATSGQELAPPSAEHWLGTDRLGRDEWSRLVVGGRRTLLTALAACAISVGGGLSLAAVGINPLTRPFADVIIDVLLAFPPILGALVIRTALPAGPFTLAIAIGVANIGSYGRVALDATSQARKYPFIEGAHSIGASQWHIFSRHLLPAAASTLFAFGAVIFAWSILYGASLSYLGLGDSLAAPEWGLMIAQGRGTLIQAPQLVFLPSAMIMLCVWLAFRLSDAMAAPIR